MSFSKTENTHNMNTPKANKPKSLLATLALYAAQFYQNRCKSRGHAHKAWEQVSDESKTVAAECMAQVIPEALARLTGSADFPTRAALRSYLSVNPGDDFDPPSIDGFNDLYEELRTIFTLRHIVEVTALREQNAGLAASTERKDVEIAKLRHDFQSAANSYEKQVLAAESRITELTRLLGDKTTGIDDRNVVICEHEKTIERLHQSVNSLRETNTAVVNRNTALQRKNEELVGLPKPYHWDDIETMGAIGNITFAPSLGDNLTVDHILSVMVKPQPFHDGRPIVLVMHDNAQDVIIAKLQEDLSKANEYNRRANADCKTYAENAAKWQKDAQRLNADMAVSATNNAKITNELNEAVESKKKLESMLLPNQAFVVTHLREQVEEKNKVNVGLFDMNKKLIDDVAKLSDTIEVLRTENKRVAGMNGETIARQSSEIATLRKSVETLSNQVLAAKAEEWDRCISVTAQTVSEILKEFRIDSPTNSIGDMVRAACEAKVNERLAVKSQLDRQDKELKELKSKRFGSPVEKVMAFRKEHGGSLDDGTMGQIVHHILTATDLAEHTRTARSMEDQVNVVGHTPVPERQYEGGIPRTEPDSADMALIRERIRSHGSVSTWGKKKHDKFDIACGLVCLGGGALGILFYAAKFLGFLS